MPHTCSECLWTLHSPEMSKAPTSTNSTIAAIETLRAINSSSVLHRAAITLQPALGIDQEVTRANNCLPCFQAGQHDDLSIELCPDRDMARLEVAVPLGNQHAL